MGKEGEKSSFVTSWMKIENKIHSREEGCVLVGVDVDADIDEDGADADAAAGAGDGEGEMIATITEISTLSNKKKCSVSSLIGTEK